MNDVFAIRADGYDFKELDLTLMDVLRHKPEEISVDDVLEFSKRNTKFSKWWWTPETKFIGGSGSEASIPDISPWIDATLVLSPKAYRFLGEVLSEFGELLPVKVYGETYYIFACNTFGQEDVDSCHFDESPEVVDGLKELSFLSEVAGSLVFKSKVELCLSLFCSVRFKGVVESYGLTGVVFSEKLIEDFS